MNNVLVMLANGFEETEALTCVDVFRRANVNVDMCALEGENSLGLHNILVKCDVNLQNADLDKYNVVIFPGGVPGSCNLKSNQKVIDLVNDFIKKDKIVAAICAAPTVLKKAEVIEGKTVTSYPGFKDQLGKCNYVEDKLVVEDGNLITSRGPATAIYFALKILERISGKEKAQQIKDEMLLSFVEDNIK